MRRCGRSVETAPAAQGQYQYTAATMEFLATRLAVHFRQVREDETPILDKTGLTGSYDFILEVYGKDLDALSNVVLKKLIRVPNVRDMQSSVVLATVKRSMRIPLGHLAI